MLCNAVVHYPSFGICCFSMGKWDEISKFAILTATLIYMTFTRNTVTYIYKIYMQITTQTIEHMIFHFKSPLRLLGDKGSSTSNEVEDFVASEQMRKVILLKCT